LESETCKFGTTVEEAYVGVGRAEKAQEHLLILRVKGDLSQEEFEEAKAALSDKIFGIEARQQTLASSRATADSFVRFAELQLGDMAHVWRIASPEQRERVQNLLFERGLDYSPESGFSNRSNSSLFNVLEEVDFQNTTMVEAAGVEPASEIAVSRESPCVVTFRRFRNVRSERTRYARR
jgi:hypothetical protein